MLELTPTCPRGLIVSISSQPPVQGHVWYPEISQGGRIYTMELANAISLPPLHPQSRLPTHHWAQLILIVEIYGVLIYYILGVFT